jgi:hypothetical protein
VAMDNDHLIGMETTQAPNRYVLAQKRIQELENQLLDAQSHANELQRERVDRMRVMAEMTQTAESAVARLGRAQRKINALLLEIERLTHGQA